MHPALMFPFHEKIDKIEPRFSGRNEFCNNQSSLVLVRPAKMFLPARKFVKLNPDSLKEENSPIHKAHWHRSVTSRCYLCTRDFEPRFVGRNIIS